MNNGYYLNLRNYFCADVGMFVHVCESTPEASGVIWILYNNNKPNAFQVQIKALP